MRSLILAVAVVVFGATSVAAQGVVVKTVDRVVAPGFQLQTANLNLINKRGPNTEDHIFYNPTDGTFVVGITNHPQVFGFNGEYIRPQGQPRGDCWASASTGMIGATTFKVADLDGDGLTQEVLLYRATDGKWVEFKIDLLKFFPGCDTTDAF